MPTVKALARDLIARQGVLVIAHRGASFRAPENTLPAFAYALDARADLVELDYHHSKDGVPVVFHDKTLDRTTDAVARWAGARLPLAARTWADLSTLDAGTWFDAQFADTRIPSLAEALGAIQPRGMTLIERKAGDAATLLDLLAKGGHTESVVVQAFDWDFLADCAKRDPRCVLGALGKGELTAGRLDAIERCGARVVVWKHKDVDAAVVKAVHARGLKLWVYTVDAKAHARAIVKLAVDGIITNRPAALRAVLGGESR